MKRHYQVILFFCLMSMSVSAQKYYITNLYVYDMFLMNPASAGVDKSCYNIGAFYQNQWLGMDNSPTTQIINFQGPITGKLGFGSYVYNDRNGNMGELGLHQAFSYEVLLSKTRHHISSLAFGLGFTAEQTKIDESGFGLPGANDPAISGGINSGWGFNFNAGLIYKYDDYQLGVSVTNMLDQNNPLFMSPEEPEQPIDFHIYASSMYKIVDRDIYLEPIVMYRQNTLLDKRLDLTLKGTFPTPDPDYTLWSLVSYRHNVDYQIGKSLGLGVTGGINYKKIGFGFEYQLGLTGAQLDYGSAYQLLLRYSFCTSRENGAIPCSIARQNKKSRYKGLSW
ncbi:PorP/SprF family type IX secretion system membrane protein [Saccharicrinis aurantiacus]|uniref:PorP/SprF family type IX secretion system membrane protein n=1 Tax=Saccharicrinis aurantiacus TaxID=1849719 RepID=UPI002490FA99|nr:PorP/SprF family type IX secretion system membrane protein [Saccharicrinis aurantiacus]